jgi:hypothetical protein
VIPVLSCRPSLKSKENINPYWYLDPISSRRRGRVGDIIHKTNGARSKAEGYLTRTVEIKMIQERLKKPVYAGEVIKVTEHPSA